MAEFMVITFLVGMGASLAFNFLFNLTALTTGRRTRSWVSFGAVTRLGFWLWLLSMGIYGLMKLGM
jgi:hypothetical protein